MAIFLGLVSDGFMGILCLIILLIWVIKSAYDYNKGMQAKHIKPNTKVIVIPSLIVVVITFFIFVSMTNKGMNAYDEYNKGKKYHHKENDYEKAISSFTKAIKNCPTELRLGDYYLARARCYYDAGRVL